MTTKSKSPFNFYNVKQILLDSDGKQVPEDDPVYEIMNNVVIPGHLRNVRFRIQETEDYQNGLIFVGEDSKGRLQYYYGTNHVQTRNNSRLDTVIETAAVKPLIDKYIKTNCNLKQPITKEYVFGVLLQLEMNFFIRLGKEKYLKENGTTGLGTLTKDHITQQGSKYILRFTGKTGVEQELIFDVDSTLGKHFTRLLKLDSTFIFSDESNQKISESFIYSQMKLFGIKMKDLRTYGVNKIFVDQWSSIVNDTTIKHKNKKAMLKQAIENTAQIIGHEPGTCKLSYLVKEILDLTTEDWFSCFGETYTLTKVLNYISKINGGNTTKPK